ncbi:LamG-like jellyroll fold domain-containing protein [uncultured Microbacterium sp.]|uniref:LamG-like jellyroll fold domain-containing protein n=1 Tax=uncultured Microbacterium sp. TaxID=191216 RepID=UPI0035C9E939
MATPTSHPMRRLVRRCAAVGTTVGLAAGLLAAGTASTATAAPAEDLASRFTLAVLPDTQFYSRYSSDQFVPRYGTDPYAVQTKWLAENKDELRIPFVTQLGDIVDRAGVEREWVAADNAMKTLEAAPLAYSTAPGNHDVSNSNVLDTALDPATEPFNRWFGPARANGQPTYRGSDPTGMSQYHVFEAEGQKYLVLALTWNSSDATLAWAQSVLDANPNLPTILTTHSLINIAPDQVTPIETGDSERMWDKLIRSNDQVFLTLNGHFHGHSRQVKKNDFGHDVAQIVIDYQMAYEGGNGYLGLIQFDLSNNTLSMETGSPWVTFKPRESLTSYDQPLLDQPNRRFTIPMDFEERFASFDPSFTAGTADEPSLSQAARDILLDGFEGPDAISTELPGNELDFVEAEGTLAHWRFNKNDGVLGADAVVEDIAGDNDLTRVDPAQTNAVGATWDDVTVEKTNVHGFSSDGAAACFANSSGSRYSYLTTAPDAAVNNADLTNGYTIETFVKMGADWSASSNQWSKFLTRSGNRSLMGAPETRWDWTASPTALGISNLREFQFTSLPADTTKGDRVNWSGEIMVGAWSHVAVVNDPATATTTMYVDGAPVLRNANDVVGQAGMADMPWIIGSDWVDNAARNGWNGCVGETRIINRPTTPDEWLTQRADLSGFTVDESPKGTLPAGTPSVRFAGTGFPGAEVRLNGLGDAEAVVAADGTWEFEMTDGLAGAHELALVQALGSRASEPVSIEFAVEQFNVPSSATTRTLAGKKYVSVVATNNEAIPVDITIQTEYGSKTFTAVKPGKSASVSFNSRAATIGAGSATVAVTGIVGGTAVTMTKTAAYPAS